MTNKQAWDEHDNPIEWNIPYRKKRAHTHRYVKNRCIHCGKFLQGLKTHGRMLARVSRNPPIKRLINKVTR